MKKYAFFSRFIFPALLLLLFASCKKDCINEPGNENLGSTDASVAAAKNSNNSLVNAVRQATARYHSTTLAIAAGYEPDDHCVAVPGLGGMGYHWANPELVDPVFDPLKPEVMLYASGPGDQPRLVAVEYIVINVGQPRPMFGDHLFDIGGTPVPVAHWSLHLWVHEPNPNGIFTPFNPNISCP
jgi:hypothetical protein